MIPFLDRGSAAIRQAGDEAKQTASVMTGEQAEALERTNSRTREIVKMEADVAGFWPDAHERSSARRWTNVINGFRDRGH